MNKLHAAFGRVSLPLQAFFVVWTIISVPVFLIPELHENLPWWTRLVLGLPYASLSLYAAIYLDIVGVKAISGMVRRNKVPQSDPVTLYEIGDISHGEMMERINQRDISDIAGFRMAVLLVGLLLILILGVFPRNPDNSVKATVLTPALALLGAASVYLVCRVSISRPLRWASYCFIAVAVIGVPLGIIAMFRG